MFKFSLGSFGAFQIFADLVSRKRLIVERNGQNLDLRGKYLVYIEYFRLLIVAVQLGSFGAFPICGDLVHVVSQKQLIVERNGRKFVPKG